MELKIDNDTLVKSIQHEFTAVYPYLKIEFVADSKKWGGHSKVEKIAPTTYFKSLYRIDRNIAININPNRTVAEVEKDFKENIGLAIQLYRRSGNVWIETSLTDDWTLGRQNDAGEVLSMHGFHKNKS